MANYYYFLGLKLPEPPQYDMTVHPYAVLVQNTNAYSYYELYYSTNPFVVRTVDESLKIVICPGSSFGSTGYSLPDRGWGPIYNAGPYDQEYTINKRLLWSNHNVNFEDGAVYMAGSEPILEEEAIATADLSSISFTLGWLAGRRMAIPGNLIKNNLYPILAPGNSWYKGSTSKNSVTSIQIVDEYTPIGNEKESWAADIYGNGSIMCYITTKNRLMIAGNGSGKIMANEDSSYLFGDPNIQSGFVYVQTLFGQEFIDFSNTVNMSNMFSSRQVVSLDISSMNTSKVTNMWGMFQGCGLLRSLDLSNFNTSSVTNVGQLCLGCDSLTSLDLRGWDISNIAIRPGLFEGCPAMTIYVSSEEVKAWVEEQWLASGSEVIVC